jgi:TolB-like protein
MGQSGGAGHDQRNASTEAAIAGTMQGASTALIVPATLPAEAGLEIALLGQLRVRNASGRSLLPRARKTQGLLAFLALSIGRPVRRSHVAGLLWDRVTDEQARNSLRQAVAELVDILAPCGIVALEAGREEILLRSPVCTTDLARIEAAMQDEAAEWPRPGGALLEEMDGISTSFDHWLAQERSRIENRLRDGFEARIERLCRTEASGERRIAAAKDLLAVDPTHERAWRLIIAELGRLGDMGQALREYARCEQTLRRLLDAAPSAETQALRQRLKRGGWAAPAPPQPAAPLEAAVPVVEEPPERQASIAVLPFTVAPEGAEASFLASGLAEGIIQILSGIGDLMVISRGSALAYAGRVADPRLVGQELRVRYALQGHVSAIGGKLRVYAELSETATGRVVRAHRHDATPADVFALQDEVSAAIVAAIAPSVRAHDLAKARRKPPNSLNAYDLLLSGLDLMYLLDRAPFEQAGDMLRRAITLDPGFAAPCSHLATWHNFRTAQGWTPAAATDRDGAAQLSARALQLDHNDAVALAIQGQVLSFTRRDYIGARQFLDRAIMVGPSCPMAWVLSSATHGWTGDGVMAVEHAERALRISPFDPFAFFIEHMISQGHYVAGAHEAAVEWGRRAVARNARLTSNLRTLAAALVATGRREAARAVAARVMQIEPGFRLGHFASRTPFEPGIRAVHVARLREAGLPD